jgi:SAM-dependent methyltransferase
MEYDSPPPDSSWGRVAALYRWQLPLERPALAAPRRRDRVLDLGTGTAGLLAQLARAPEPPALAVGADCSAAMLARADPLPERWQLLRADASRLPFADDSFDLVTAAYLLHIVAPAQRARILAEAARVLSRHGRFVVVTPAEPRSSRGRALYAPFRWSGCRSRGLLAGFCPLDPRQDLERAGFVVRAVRFVDRGYRSWCVLASR